MFSQTAEYALRAVVCIAGQKGRSVTTHEIADATRVPPDYLSKVLQALGRGGLVLAQRGKHGGYALARPAQRVSILEVVNAVDPFRRIRSCPLGLPGHGLKLCGLHRRMDDAVRHVEETLASASIADLLAETGSVRPLCANPEAAHA
jgi:Rrf2 family transcriptional regulator, nitric oxide-sensitive transcriptional repressor